ncbi:MAG: hypothetical protein KGY81_08085, partial [Phycisphaerae bacterium]|nr:hypothetical protein [Phycisphaerae bacterium]
EEELVDPSLPTTVKVDCSDAPVQSTLMRWNADGELDSMTVDSTVDDAYDAVAMCLDSPNDTTYCTVAWL